MVVSEIGRLTERMRREGTCPISFNVEISICGVGKSNVLCCQNRRRVSVWIWRHVRGSERESVKGEESMGHVLLLGVHWVDVDVNGETGTWTTNLG